MRLQLIVIQLEALQETVVADLPLLIEHHEDAHLVRRHRHFVLFVTILADSRSQVSLALIEFPVQLAPIELGHVVLLVDAHALLDFERQGDGLDGVVRLLPR